MSEYRSELLKSLLPRLQSRLRSQPALVAVDVRARSAEAVLDQLHYAAFLVDEACRLLYMNSAAATLLERHDGLALMQERFTISDGSSRDRVRALVETTIASGRVASGSQSRATTIRRPSGKAAYQIQLKPLRMADGLGNESVQALALVNDPDESYVFSDAVLRSLYGFSKAESEIVKGLIAGKRLDQIADSRGVRLGTVRIQMKGVLRKCGVRRQTDLLRLILSLPIAVADDPAA